MARFEFGGVMAAWVVSTAPATDTAGNTYTAVTIPTEAETLTIYDAPDGSGNVVTDFIDEHGLAVAALATSTGDEYIPRFSGPDGVQRLWVQSPSGRWLPMPRWDDGSGVSEPPEAPVKLEGANQYTYPNSQSPPWLVLKRPNDNSSSTTWSNMIEFWYFDNSTQQYRLGTYVNEKGLTRTRGTTPSDVVARFMAHPSQSLTAAVLEATADDNTQKILQVFTGRVQINVPVVVPYLVNPLGERLYWGSGDPTTDPAYADYRPDVGAAWIDYSNPPAGGE